MMIAGGAVTRGRVERAIESGRTSLSVAVIGRSSESASRSERCS